MTELNDRADEGSSDFEGGEAVRPALRQPDPDDPGSDVSGPVDWRAHDLSTEKIDPLLGPPRLLPGEDIDAFRKLEEACIETMIDNNRKLSYVDIRSWTNTVWEGRRYERARAQMLAEEIGSQIVMANNGNIPAASDIARDLILGLPVPPHKIKKILGKAAVSYDYCAAKAMERVLPRYAELTALAEKAEKRARDIERHMTRREAERYRLDILRRKAFDLGALSDFG